MNIHNRGYLKEGYFADLTIFDEEEIKKAIPNQTKSFGIKKVFINGKLILDDEQLLDEYKNYGKDIPII